jgi:hypothetical protein
MHRIVKTFAVAAPLAAAALLGSNQASACGGCFVPPAKNTVVSGHRMALAVSMKRTVLWDQIQYQGNPEDFSWVLPIKPGAKIEEAASEWIDTLEAATVTTVQPPPLNCGNNGGGTFGCGSSAVFTSAKAGGDSGDHSVNVVHQETVGPYDSVTLSSKDANALTDWLKLHGYDIPQDVQPVIAAYVKEGFDFIALRLTPGNGVNLMKPVRVITDGASPVLPLRMVSAGTGAFTSIILYVIGEGRWATANFPNAEVPLANLTWDGKTNDSNYADLRSATLGLNGGLTWITTYAQQGPLLDYTGGNYGGGNIGSVYFNQSANGTSDYQKLNECVNKIETASRDGLVVDTCDPVTKQCGQPGAGEIDARTFECDKLTDLSTALVGMHPKDVWVTRLEANLPRAALGNDLQLQAAAVQGSIDSYHETPHTENYECPAAPLGQGSSSRGKGAPPGNGTPFVLAGLGALAALLAARRVGLVRAASGGRSRT